MIAFIFSLVIIAFEAWGLVYYFDTFADCRLKRKILRFPILYASVLIVVYMIPKSTSSYYELVKYAAMIALLVIYCILVYKAHHFQSIFLAIMNYTLLVMVDFTFVWIFGIDKNPSILTRLTWIMYRVVWILILMCIRKKLSGLKRYMMTNSVYLKGYIWFPLISSLFGLYYMGKVFRTLETGVFYSLISLAIIAINIVSLYFMLYMAEKEEKIKKAELQLRKNQNQIQVFRDMQSLYERQGRKLHDYKKQLITLRGLLEEGEVKSAINLTNELTESIDVEMSEINVGHPVVNAVLNQEHRIAKGKEIGMILSLGNADNIKLKDEEVVVLFGNLLENAIHECEKVVKAKGKAAIHLKIANMDQNTVITVQNPVLEPVTIKEGEVVNLRQEGHGIGLSNVREVVEKYDGSFAISCDEEFTAVVII